MASNLTTVGSLKNLADNLRAARADIGSGGGSGETYLKVVKGTGQLIFGAERTPLPPNHRFAIHLEDVYHGYLVSTIDKQITERHLVPLSQGGQRPIPPGGHTTRALDVNRKPTDQIITLAPGEYGTYEGGGPRNATVVNFNSVDEPGFRLSFTAWGPSNANRIGNLLDQAIVHLGSAEGQAGFIHPVVILKGNNYQQKDYGRVDHLDFEPGINGSLAVDWLHVDGKTLLSQRAKTAIEDSAKPSAQTEERAPWDDDDTTDREREFLNAG